MVTFSLLLYIKRLNKVILTLVLRVRFYNRLRLSYYFTRPCRVCESKSKATIAPQYQAIKRQKY